MTVMTKRNAKSRLKVMWNCKRMSRLPFQATFTFTFCFLLDEKLKTKSKWKVLLWIPLIDTALSSTLHILVWILPHLRGQLADMSSASGSFLIWLVSFSSFVGGSGPVFNPRLTGALRISSWKQSFPLRWCWGRILLPPTLGYQYSVSVFISIYW